MKRFLEPVTSQVVDPIKFRRLNGLAVLLWTVILPVSIAAGWMKAVVFVSFLSIYANWATHLSAWAASRSEARQVETEEAEINVHAQRANVDVHTHE